MMKRSCLFILLTVLLCLCLCPHADEACLTIPAGTTVIETEAFYGDSSLQTVILPEGLVKIGRRAFEFCDIETVVFPSTLKNIEDEAFQFCSLKELHLLEGTEHIGTDAFCSCRELQSAYLPDAWRNACSMRLMRI